MPSGKSNVSGSENGAVVNQPRSRSQITGGLRHSSIVVQIEKVGANVVALDDEVGAVADADLVDLREEVVGGVAREDVREPGLDADADEREQAALAPLRLALELLVAELDAGLLVRAARDAAARASSPCRGRSARLERGLEDRRG